MGTLGPMVRFVCCFSLFLAALLRGAPEPTRAPAPISDPVVKMDAVRVTASRVTAAEAEGPQVVENYDPDRIANTGAFDVVEFLATLPSPEPGTKQLVLVDGRPTYLDLASLPLGMIEAIEVSRDGSMPHLGAYNNGRIVNIRLKKEYVGGEMSGRYTGAFEGGGQQRNVRLSASVKRGNSRTLVSVDLRESGALAATDRDFSSNQDHRARGGRDLRLPWGYPAVVEAVSGALAGTGESVLLVPPGAATAPHAPADFLRPELSVGSTAVNQRRFDTAPYRNLSNPSRGAGVNVNQQYTFSERLQLSFTASYRRDSSTRVSGPPVTPASDATSVPAAFNPFGQDVRVGLVHVEFGPTYQESLSERTQFALQADGRINPSWRWDAGLGHRRNSSQQETPDIDPDKFSAALRAIDPALRFNPFVDARGSAVNAAVYPTLVANRASEQESENTELEVSLRGTLATWAGGPVGFNLDGQYDQDERERASNRTPGAPITRTESSSRGREGSASLTLPHIGKDNMRPLLRRLETQLSAQVESASNDGAQKHAEAGLVWSPVAPLLLRARYARETADAPTVVIAGTDTLSGDSLIDSRRGGEPLANVPLITQGTVQASPQLNEQISIGATIEPSQLRGLRIRASYRARLSRHLYEEDFDPQDIINNEAALPGRVLRESPSADDIALSRPGTITGVDVTPGSTGRSVRRDVDFDLEYRMPERPFGTLRFETNFERRLRANYEVLPGVPFVQQSLDGSRRPKWTGSGLLAWSRKAWNASLRGRYTGAVAATPEFTGLKAATTFDLHAGFRLRPPTKPGVRGETRIALSIGNLFNTGPQWADTLSGYQSGSPLGRTYSLSVSRQL